VGANRRVTLFESESQYREKATIWRVFSLLPLYGNLAGGRIWRWFAVNIPMDLGTGGQFTSDIDILARLYDFPRSEEWIYRTWEVKVSLLCKDGAARSLKSGKIERTINQLRVYRDFGSPDVSLMDIYLCESGFMSRNVFPLTAIRDTIIAKIAELSKDGFGYQLLPFEHGKDGKVDVGLLAMGPNEMNPLQTTFNILPARQLGPRGPFARLVHRIDQFFEQSPDRSHNHLKQSAFCRDCRTLQLIKMKDEHRCPSCRDDLILQS
jgi:hypothetical protein